jgi:SAM-dependent methyltransferase
VGVVRSTLFFGCYAVGRALERAAHDAALLAYHAAAGLTRLADVRAAIARQPENDGVVELGDDYATSGLTPWEAAFYPRFLHPQDRILLVGSGRGRDLLALRERGYRVEGLELVPARAAASRALLARRGLSADVVEGSIETAALGGRYDAVVFAWFCYSVIPGASTRVGVLRRVAAHLAPGGRVLLSYIPCDAPPRTAAIRVAQLVARASGADWRPEAGDVLWVSGRHRIAHYTHLHWPGTVEAEARAAGLAVAFEDSGEVGTAVLTPRPA